MRFDEYIKSNEGPGDLCREIDELKMQIEKMKCCRNCKNYINKDCLKYSDCHKHNKWELAE